MSGEHTKDAIYCWSSYYQTERTQNNYRNTLYVHLFKYGSYVIIQYWTFYPYNDFINNHEGDWEHINVWLSSDDPSTANIVKVEFYFHKKYLDREPGQFQIDGSHAIVYVGGERPSWAPGVHSGGNFPEAKYWINAGEAGVNEYVNGLGPVIGYASFFDNDPNDKRGLVILPDADDINYSLHPDMSWFKAKIPWGVLDPETFDLWIGKFVDGWWIELGNDPPPGPAYRAGWNAVGSAGGKYAQY